jgi:hypothetical protein
MFPLIAGIEMFSSDLEKAGSDIVPTAPSAIVRKASLRVNFI